MLKLWELQREPAAVGAPLLEFNVTPARLDALLALTDRFDNMRPRLAIGARPASNASVPALLSKMRAAFKALDKILKGLDHPDPFFMAEYQKARVND